MIRACSIEPDDRDFWHINFFELIDMRDAQDATPDSFATTKTGASLDDAIALAKERFSPSHITVWSKCSSCGGTGTCGDVEIDWDECDECENGLVSEQI